MTESSFWGEPSHLAFEHTVISVQAQHNKSCLVLLIMLLPHIVSFWLCFSLV